MLDSRAGSCIRKTQTPQNGVSKRNVATYHLGGNGVFDSEAETPTTTVLQNCYTHPSRAGNPRERRRRKRREPPSHGEVEGINLNVIAFHSNEKKVTVSQIRQRKAAPPKGGGERCEEENAPPHKRRRRRRSFPPCWVVLMASSLFECCCFCSSPCGWFCLPSPLLVWMVLLSPLLLLGGAGVYPPLTLLGGAASSSWVSRCKLTCRRKGCRCLSPEDPFPP